MENENSQKIPKIMKDLVSIIIPTYNPKEYLFKKCISSLFNQTYKYYEIIVIDSGTSNFVEEYVRNKKIKYYRSEKGVSKQRNYGLEIAFGNYICFIDSDDYVNETYIENLLKNLKNSNCDVAMPQIQKVIYGNEKIIQSFLFENNCRTEFYNKDNFFKGAKENNLAHPIKLYTREIIGDTRFNTQLSHGEDLMFNFELSKKHFKIIFSKESIYYYTAEKGDNAASKRLEEQSINILEELYRIYKIDSVIRKQGDILYQFDYLFMLYFNSCLKYHDKVLLRKILKYRRLYLKNNHSFKTLFKLYFPNLFYNIKKRTE